MLKWIPSFMSYPIWLPPWIISLLLKDFRWVVCVPWLHFQCSSGFHLFTETTLTSVISDFLVGKSSVPSLVLSYLTSLPHLIMLSNSFLKIFSFGFGDNLIFASSSVNILFTSDCPPSLIPKVLVFLGVLGFLFHSFSVHCSQMA